MHLGVFGAGVLAGAILLAPAPAAAVVELDGDVALGVGRMSGDTTYTIGGDVTIDSHRGQGSGTVPWPLSELAWPLDAALLTLDAGVRVGERWSARLSVASNLGKGTGVMEDSDWGVYYLEFGRPYRSDSLDVFSTSDAEFDALTVDAVVRGRVFEAGGFTLSLGAGYLHERFDFTATDVDQYSPSYPAYAPWLRGEGITSDPFRYAGEGTGITYEVTYRIPYLELSGGYAVGDALTIDARVAWSPFVTATDRDDHVLRGKLSEGDGDGGALVAGLTARYAFAGGWFVGAGVDWRRIETSGTQTQTWYRTESPGDPESPREGDRATIDVEITSSQLVGRIELGYAF